jgi:hypothetical protein
MAAGVTTLEFGEKDSTVAPSGRATLLEIRSGRCALPSLAANAC